MLALAGLLEWFVFTPAILNFHSLLAGPFLDMVFCVLLAMLNCHVVYWNRKLQDCERVAKYVGILS